MRARHLFDQSVAHHRNAVADGESLDLVMGNDHTRLVEVGEQHLDLAAHFLAQRNIEPAKRLVKQKALRIADNRAAHRHALFFAFREAPGNAPHGMAEFENIGNARHPLVDFFFVEFFRMQRKGQILGHRQARIKGIKLEYHGDIALRRFEIVDPLAGDENVAFAGPFQPADHPESRRLAAARRAEQAHDFAGFDIEIDGIHRCEFAKAFRQVA